MIQNENVIWLRLGKRMTLTVSYAIQMFVQQQLWLPMCLSKSINSGEQTDIATEKLI